MYPYRDAPATVEDLRGTLAPTRAGRIPTFDDITSYGIMVAYGRMRVGAPAMSTLMNRYVLPAAKGPIKHVDVSFVKGAIHLKGIIQKGVLRVGFRASATAAPTAGGDLRIHITRMVAGGILSKGLMDALGLTMQKVAQPRDTAVFRIVDDDMLVPVASMFPPPKVGARIAAVTVTPRAIIVQIGRPSDAPPPPLTAPSFVAYRGGTIRFAHLTMTGVNLTLLPEHGTLGFSAAAYYRQLEGGYALARPHGALIARVPAYSALSPGASRQ